VARGIMSKIVLTGHRGFIGKNLELSLSGHDVIGVESEHMVMPYWREALRDLLSDNKPDVLFHVGACSSTNEKRTNYMMIRNYESTRVMVDWCKENSVPLIYSSSAANYGDKGLYPSNLYGWSKYVAEHYVLCNGGVALRYFNVYGPGEEKKGNMASIAYQSYIKHMLGKDVFLFPCEPSRDFVYVRDVIKANIHAWNNFDKLKGKYYEVGSGKARAFEDIMDIMEIPYRYHNKEQIPEGYQFFTCSNKEKWMDGWSPEYDLESGLNAYLQTLQRVIK
jgi:ADP-L-glycero-D-manno-heptose 6-epimerase